MMVETLSPEVAAEWIASSLRGDVDLVDVRDEREFATGHVVGARNIPLDTLRTDPDAFLARDRAVLFICAKGVRSLSAAKLAERLGYERVFNLEGGTSAWTKAGFQLDAAIRTAA